MTVPATMRAVVLRGHGGLDQLDYRNDVPVPVPDPDDVLIEVAACGMNNTDINTRVGWYAKSVTSATGDTEPGREGSWGGAGSLPLIQGADPVGRVAAVGSAAAAALVGRRVLVDGWLRDPGGALENARYIGSDVDGGYAEYVTVPAANAHPIESELSDVELATFPCSYSTAEHMLERAGVMDGHWVLVTGASGGVGGALVQLAKRRGARVVAVTSTPKAQAVEAIGADVVLDKASEDLATAILEATKGIDVFADVIGGETFAPLLETVKRGGHYVTAGAIAGPIVPLDLRTLYLHDLTMHGATVLPPQVFANLIGYIERGEIKPIVGATFPLKDVAQAQTAFLSEEKVGAIVIEVGPPRVV